MSSSGPDSNVDSSRALLGRIQSIREDLSHMSHVHNQLKEHSSREMTRGWIHEVYNQNPALDKEYSRFTNAMNTYDHLNQRQRSSQSRIEDVSNKVAAARPSKTEAINTAASAL